MPDSSRSPGAFDGHVLAEENRACAASKLVIRHSNQFAKLNYRRMRHFALVSIRVNQFKFQARRNPVRRRSLVNCDICGREITGPAFKVRVEGAKMLVCSSCQNLGTPYYDERPVPTRPASRVMLRTPRSTYRRAPELPAGMEELEVAENYSTLVSRKRTKLGLSQGELANRVKEKLSVIQKIETGKIAPDTKLCRELEHELKIKLLIPRKEATVPKTPMPSEVTLGDIIHVKGKSKLDELG